MRSQLRTVATVVNRRSNKETEADRSNFWGPNKGPRCPLPRSAAVAGWVLQKWPQITGDGLHEQFYFQAYEETQGVWQMAYCISCVFERCSVRCGQREECMYCGGKGCQSNRNGCNKQFHDLFLGPGGESANSQPKRHTAVSLLRFVCHCLPVHASVFRVHMYLPRTARA